MNSSTIEFILRRWKWEWTKKVVTYEIQAEQGEKSRRGGNRIKVFMREKEWKFIPKIFYIDKFSDQPSMNIVLQSAEIKFWINLLYFLCCCCKVNEDCKRIGDKSMFVILSLGRDSFDWRKSSFFGI